MKDIGCFFQLNMLSIIGHYGKSVQELANYLVKKNYYDLLGTDLHHAGHLEALKQSSLTNQLSKLVGSGRFRNAEL